MKSFAWSSVLALTASSTAILAVKDDEYYRAGMGNPNADLKMYWADAHNVLEDLSQFSALYVQYQHCAWSQNQIHDSGEEEGGGSGDETDYWYVGATPSFSANVAYSLYGALQGEAFSGCNANTFINSFTTNNGFEAFASALYYAGATSTDYSQSYSSECQGGAGVACDYHVGFAYVTYSSNTCDPYYATYVSDTMGYMNAAFQSAQCVKIYDASQYSYSNNGNGYGNGYGNNYQGQYGYNNYYQYYGTALSLLYYSNACFIQNFWAPNGGCPDPYGRLQVYQQNFNKGVRYSMKVDPYVTYRINMQKGKKLVKVGAILFMAAAIFYLFEQFMAFRKRRHQSQTLKKAAPTTEKKHLELAASDGLKKKRSMVGLVLSATGKMKDAVNKSFESITSKKAQASRDDVANPNDGDDILVKDQSKSTKGSYQAPEVPVALAPDQSSAPEVAAPVESVEGVPNNQEALEAGNNKSAVEKELPKEVLKRSRSSKSGSKGKK